MAQVTYRANLSAKSFPFISDNWGRTVIVAQYDNTFNRQVSPSSDQDRDVGIPQIYYCHNVLPFAQGFQSVGYTPILPSGITDAKEIWIIRSAEASSVYMCVNQTGSLYISDGGAWVLKSIPGSLDATRAISIAYVSGITYIYIANQGCIKYNFMTGAFESVTLTGLDVTKTIGICGSFGYLIAWNISNVAWSSTIDPTDFVPSLVTGAGGGQVEGARGNINFCLPHLLGFIVYTTNNAVAALYSGNARYPFNFREIVASGGISSTNLISYDANTGNHYAYTTSGLQLISTSQSQTVYPELTDFISGKLFEDYDEITKVFSLTVLSDTMQKKITVVADRYLIISYGVSSLTHALVYDTAQNRWGKLKIPHVSVIEYQLPNTSITEIPKQSIGFLQADGTLKTVSFNVYDSTSNGVLLMGKYQFVRARLIQLDTVTIEDVVNPGNFNLDILAAIDGKNNVISPGTLLSSGNRSQTYGCRAIGINVSLLFQGQFKVESLTMQFNIQGKR